MLAQKKEFLIDYIYSTIVAGSVCSSDNLWRFGW